MSAWLLSGAGLAVLLVAGDLLVRGAVNLSLRVGIPALIVSLTIVAFGTSAPELLIGISAVQEGKPGLALGNVVGSNTANVLLVLGLPALVSRMHTSRLDTRRSYLVMIVASVAFVALCFLGPLTWSSGLVLLAALAAVLWDQVRVARRHMAADRTEDEIADLEGADPDMPWWRIALFLALGLAGLPIGADLLVDNASIIASDFGVSDAVIGLTLVALGTSLPELATTVMAGLRGQADVAMGNAIGSNLFNLLGIIGATTLFGAIPVEQEFLQFDLWVMLAASLLLAPFALLRVDLGRRWGGLLTMLYLLYVTVVLS
ncbi:K+-dependent Na+/Ca+ exchanger related-protein [Pseudooceanicola batsensis HTCC2597]|uniref:K+-dependent Na+/Ca+ exchanger related-protein n=1 Tax=Pseudooceanicola batsensis (strain ATCC BAA-863 / DSM 15984 / KCTC 12145 / HTCC2597) TaxID=252305 RepID=A3TU12_PSEBH|nr:calcium/sodium antiporter [Pseudooceanicola batsensis]EAQ05139.1 K+-dependent Na+/Ca+ exchanger related-protein [Pseudooceanicola batsensis HTCC2597]